MENKMEWIKDHRRQLMAGFAVFAVLILIIGLCLSWFVYNETLSTVGKIKKPTSIELLGPNATAMEEIDLAYNPKTDVRSDGTVTVTRAFSVKTKNDGEGFKLFLAHTTNISGLNVELYAANGDLTPSSAENLISDSGYVNKDKSTGIATADSISKTFGEQPKNLVQKNANPLYWAKTFEQADVDQSTNVHNFIIKFTWNETQKETDVAYVMGQTI